MQREKAAPWTVPVLEDEVVAAAGLRGINLDQFGAKGRTTAVALDSVLDESTRGTR